jgi:hypothetical protein
MAVPTGGQFIFAANGSAVALGLTTDGSVPPVPAPVAGDFNIEVFTSVTGGALPALASGFQAGVIDNQGAIGANGLLTGTQLQLFTGDYSVVDSPTGANSPATVILGSGNQILGSANQTVYGAAGDTLIGGMGNQFLDGLSGAESIIGGGTGYATIIGGVGDSITGGSGVSVLFPIPSDYIDGSAGGMTIAFGILGPETIIGSSANNGRNPIGPDTITGGGGLFMDIQGLGKGDVVNLPGFFSGPMNLELSGGTVNATAGNDLVTNGGVFSIYGGAGDTIVGGAQVVGTAGAMFIVADSGGSEVIASGTGDRITALAGTAHVVIGGATGDFINLAGNTGSVAVIGVAGGESIVGGSGANTIYGGSGDTIAAGAGGTTYVDGTAGTMTIDVGSGGAANIIGSNGAADTIIGGAGTLNYDPGATGAGDLINLAGSTGNATVNAFASGGADTVNASNGADSVWGGGGDRIAAGTAGALLATHATTVAGASIGFGSNAATGSTAAVTVGTVSGGAAVSRFSEAAGVPTDFIFYPGETAASNAAIVAASTQVTVAGVASTQFALPDGSEMTLIGVPTADFNATFFRP